jgi:glutathione synthase/RimK-type ligase-like ATP-grasp enzyme
MITKNIILTGPASDVHIKAVSSYIQQAGHQVQIVDPGMFTVKHRFAVLDEELIVDDHAYENIDAVWLRQMPTNYVSYSELNHSEISLLDREAVVKERQSLFLAWLIALSDRNVPIVNPVHSSSVFISKPTQLWRMRAAGVPVPQTLYTNSADAAQAFRQAVGPCIVKAIGGGTHAEDFDSAVIQEKLDAMKIGPIVLQEKIKGQHLRVTVVDNKIVSAVRILSEHLDYRTDDRYHAGGLYEEANLSEEGQRIALLAAQASRLNFTGIDILRDGDHHVVLECNTAPIYWDLEDKMKHPISAAIAAFLCCNAL